MRELSTDRPDKTESPYTVDAGHFQLEANLASARISGGGENQLHLESIAELNVKAGITYSTDIQFVFLSLAGTDDIRDKNGDPTHGFPLEFLPGEVTIRIKQNLLGNSGAGLGCAIMPFATWGDVSRSGNLADLGVIVPFSGDGPLGWSWGAMLVWGKDVTSASGANRGILSATVGRGIAGSMRGYLETYSETVEYSRLVSTIDAGITVAFGESWQFDFGCNAGISSLAPDWQPFVGITARY